MSHFRLHSSTRVDLSDKIRVVSLSEGDHATTTMAERTPLQRMITPRNVPGIEGYKSSIDSVLSKIFSTVQYLFALKKEMGNAFDDTIPSCLRRNIFCRLKVDLLPSLRDRLMSLCALLDRSNLLNNDRVSTFQRMLEDVVKVDEIVTEMGCCVTPVMEILRKEEPSASEESEPAHITRLQKLHPGPLESLTSILWDPWHDDLIDLLLQMWTGFDKVQDFLLNEISVDELESKWNRDSLTIIPFIGTFIEKLNRSDFQVYKIEHWENVAERQSDHLSTASEIIHSKMLAGEPTSLLLIETISAYVPIIKLIRLFFNKLCKLTNSQVHPASQMDAALLAKFLDITSRTYFDIDHFFQTIAQPPNRERPVRILDSSLAIMIKEAIEILNQFFSSPSNIHRVEVRNYQNWYMIWARQFDVAMNQFLARYINLHREQHPRFFFGEIAS